MYFINVKISDTAERGFNQSSVKFTWIYEQCTSKKKRENVDNIFYTFNEIVPSVAFNLLAVSAIDETHTIELFNDG